MKSFKEKGINVLKQIKKSNLVGLLRSKATIKELNEKIGDLGKEKKDLIDMVRTLSVEKENLLKDVERIPKLESTLKRNDKSIRDNKKKNKELEDKKVELETKLFEMNLELSKVKTQLEEYELEIEDLKSDRYLVRKLPSGRTPKTIKTRVSRGMSANVTKYMRGEHE